MEAERLEAMGRRKGQLDIHQMDRNMKCCSKNAGSVNKQLLVRHVNEKGDYM